MNEFHHVPVLAQAVVAAMAPAFSEHNGTWVDATCGGGGHTAAFLEHITPTRVVAFDHDSEALRHAERRLADAQCPVEMVHANFSLLPEELHKRGIDDVRAIVADLGVSSHQIDTADRGFSFGSDGPLDMRMDQSAGETAAELIARIDEGALAKIIREFGEEPHARRIARKIVSARPTTTGQLARLVGEAARPRRKHGGRTIHPATRTFQALRIAVNRELEVLQSFLIHAPEMLLVGGRIGVISFHSLEDRPVKRRFRELSRPPELPRDLPVPEQDRPTPRFSIPRSYAGGVTASDAEVERNPRSRSARLRVLERSCP